MTSFQLQDVQFRTDFTRRPVSTAVLIAEDGPLEGTHVRVLAFAASRRYLAECDSPYGGRARLDSRNLKSWGAASSDVPNREVHETLRDAMAVVDRLSGELVPEFAEAARQESDRTRTRLIGVSLSARDPFPVRT